MLHCHTRKLLKRRSLMHWHLLYLKLRKDITQCNERWQDEN
jgi:hypothetical protein